MLAMAIWKRGIERQVDERESGGDAWGIERGELEDPEARSMLVDVMVVSLCAPKVKGRC